jgi:hypothetical protein
MSLKDVITVLSILLVSSAILLTGVAGGIATLGGIPLEDSGGLFAIALLPVFVLNNGAYGCIGHFGRQPNHTQARIIPCCAFLLLTPLFLLVGSMIVLDEPWVGVVEIVGCLAGVVSFAAFIFVGHYLNDQQNTWAWFAARFCYFIGGAPGVAVAKLMFPDTEKFFTVGPVALALSKSMDSLLKLHEAIAYPRDAEQPLVITPPVAEEPTDVPVRLRMRAGVEVKRPSKPFEETSRG